MREMHLSGAIVDCVLDLRGSGGHRWFVPPGLRYLWFTLPVCVKAASQASEESIFWASWAMTFSIEAMSMGACKASLPLSGYPGDVRSRPMRSLTLWSRRLICDSSVSSSVGVEGDA